VLWNSAGVEVDKVGSGREAAVQDRLSRVTPPSKQALLLTAVEEFSLAEAAEIMGLREVEVAELVLSASADIARESRTSVLIIEDEPLIAMQLEQLVESLGHRICGTATTRGQARQVVAERQPGLVLADIQLADGSSGLDAVDDILAISDVPVIFITAFPERLLTGDRPEPAYLITKPFREEAVKAAISQALFFRTTTPAE
jgi:CheY-like chemotaxis protein